MKEASLLSAMYPCTQCAIITLQFLDNNIIIIDRCKCQCEMQHEHSSCFAGVTLPPYPRKICSHHQSRFELYPIEVYNQMCNYNTITNKAKNGTLELRDVTECYNPYCINDGTEYLNHQCSDIAPEWCWCSDAKGIAIEGTLKRIWNSERCCKFIVSTSASESIVEVCLATYSEFYKISHQWM